MSYGADRECGPVECNLQVSTASATTFIMDRQVSPPIDADFVLNLRTLSARRSGVQRYAAELAARFGKRVSRVSASGRGQGMIGHLWEQLILPLHCRGRLLFSPGNSGPLLHRLQVVTIHDAATFDHGDAFTGLFGRWYRWLLPKLARRALGIITISNFSRDRLTANLGIPRDKIVVVYNGITHPSSIPTAASLNKIREEFRLPARFLLFVGSHDPRKNLERLLAAFEMAAVSNLYLVLAGGGNPQLFNSSIPQTERGRVRVLGHVEERVLEGLYALAEGFIFPSLYEGFGLPPLEAMARGCPVLCSNASCLPEVCGLPCEQGGPCLYFSPLETDSIASTIKTFSTLSDREKQSMISAGRRHAEKFSWDRCARETVDALDHFLARDKNGLRASGLRNGMPVAKGY